MTVPIAVVLDMRFLLRVQAAEGGYHHQRNDI
jgi:hypothetical protein